MFDIVLKDCPRPVLGDSGCSFTCMSHEYFVNNPHLKQSFTSRKTCGRSINGEPVASDGEVQLKFSLAGLPMEMTCRVIRNLMDPIILGWDWMTKYGIMLDAKNGKLHFEGGAVPLLKNHFPIMGSYYRVFEDLTLPPFSKVHANVELVLSGDSLKDVTSTVITEPFSNNGVNFWAARTCSKVNNDRFLTEFINSTNKSVKVEAGKVIGSASFVEDNEFEREAYDTEMMCSYKGDEGYESASDLGESDQEEADDPVTVTPPRPAPKPPPHPPSPNCQTSPRLPPRPVSQVTSPRIQTPPRPPPKPPSQPTVAAGQPLSPPPKSRPHSPKFASHTASRDLSPEEIPEGAKPLHLNLSNIAKDACPYEPRLRHLLRVKRKKAFSRHDRDYGRTKLIQYRAHMKDRDQTPIAQPPYRTRPEMREVIDRQAHEMIADGLVGHSTSPYAAPILLVKKKDGNWRFLTDF